jgi:hypothetical protein
MRKHLYEVCYIVEAMGLKNNVMHFFNSVLQ